MLHIIKMMASVTAPDDLVPSWSELVGQCANDQCCHMLLLMAQSCISVDDDCCVRERLVKVSVIVTSPHSELFPLCRMQRLVCWFIRNKDVLNSQLF